MKALYKKPDGRRREFKASQGSRETRKKTSNSAASTSRSSAGSSAVQPSSGTSPHLMTLEWTDNVEPSVARHHRSTKTKLPVYGGQHPSSDTGHFHDAHDDPVLRSDWDWELDDENDPTSTVYMGEIDGEADKGGMQGVEFEDEEDLWVDIEEGGFSQWDANKHDVLDEMVRARGRGEHTNQEKCHTCNNTGPTFRCTSCFTNGVLYCQSCVCSMHNTQPFHFLEVSSLLPQERIKFKSK
jgi:hypothetical protein